MSKLKFMCPKCKHEFYAEEWATVVCPKCGTILKRVS